MTGEDLEADLFLLEIGDEVDEVSEISSEGIATQVKGPEKSGLKTPGPGLDVDVGRLWSGQRQDQTGRLFLS